MTTDEPRDMTPVTLTFTPAEEGGFTITSPSHAAEMAFDALQALAGQTTTTTAET